MSTSKQQSDVDVQAALQEIQRSQDQLLSAFETLADRLGESLPIAEGSIEQDSLRKKTQDGASDKGGVVGETNAAVKALTEGAALQAPTPASPSQRSSLTSRIVLTYVKHWSDRIVPGSVLMTAGPILSKSAFSP